MPLIPWTTQMNVGVEQFDAEHRRLADLVNLLHESILAGRTRQQLSEIFAELVRQAAEHFTHEEQLFAATDYADTAAHLAEHDRMLLRLRRMENRLRQGSSPTVYMDVMTQLRDWMYMHVLGSDQEYTEHFQRDDVRAALERWSLSGMTLSGSLLC